jgi:hypothetical protein
VFVSSGAPWNCRAIGNIAGVRCNDAQSGLYIRQALER